jgi:hypothetical protein
MDTAGNIEQGAGMTTAHGREAVEAKTGLTGSRSKTAATQAMPRNHPGGWRSIYPYDSIKRRLIEAWWIVSGQWSLHRAWQRGYDQHAQDESLRRARGGK